MDTENQEHLVKKKIPKMYNVNTNSKNVQNVCKIATVSSSVSAGLFHWTCQAECGRERERGRQAEDGTAVALKE